MWLNAIDLLLARARRAAQIRACCRYPQLAYRLPLKATFVELPAFERLRANYLSDEEFLVLQQALMARPDAGDVIPGAGGLRKLRFADRRRGKGTRGGLRVIYFHWSTGQQFWLFTLGGAEAGWLRDRQQIASPRRVEFSSANSWKA